MTAVYIEKKYLKMQCKNQYLLFYINIFLVPLEKKTNVNRKSDWAPNYNSE